MASWYVDNLDKNDCKDDGRYSEDEARDVVADETAEICGGLKGMTLRAFSVVRWRIADSRGAFSLRTLS